MSATVGQGSHKPKMEPINLVPSLNCATCGMAVMVEFIDRRTGHIRVQYPCDSCKAHRGEYYLQQITPTPTREHVETAQCGFDRNSSHSENKYVCNCGWTFP